MIQINNVSKSFHGTQALDHLQMHVPKGAIYGLVGPNGAGKSTIIRHIVGAYRPDEGEILIDGENIRENASIKEKIAYIPDEIFYFSQATTLDMMHYYKGLYPSFDEQYFYKICKCFPTVKPQETYPVFFQGYHQAGGICSGSVHPSCPARFG